MRLDWLRTSPGAVARARAVGDGAVEGHTDHGDIQLRDVLDIRHPHESRDTRIARVERVIWWLEEIVVTHGLAPRQMHCKVWSRLEMSLSL